MLFDFESIGMITMIVIDRTQFIECRVHRNSCE